MSKQQNIKVFKQTRRLSLTTYADETSQLISSTQVLINSGNCLENIKISNTNIEVWNIDTVSTIHKLSGVAHLAALNFADDYEPGGLVLEGEETQEEGLCRCSNLYESLISDQCIKQFYKYNMNHEHNDKLIYSPKVTFFLNADYKRVQESTCDIITCPAPVCCNDKNLLYLKIKNIFGSAYSSGVEILILGAWGCGAFGCNPTLVSAQFKQVLNDFPVFNKVIFAIKDEGNNLNVFRGRFQN